MSTQILEEKIVYYEQARVGNTEETLFLAIKKAEARGINTFILASTIGKTARLALKYQSAMS